MKKNRNYIMIVLAITAFKVLQANAQNEKSEINKSKPQVVENQYSLIDGIGRGFANLLTGWIEAPRGMVYYSVEWPVIGIIPGAFEGAGLTLIRTIGGGIDLITLGYLTPGNTVYDTMDIPMLPWLSPWLPDTENQNDDNEDLINCVD